MSAVQETDRLHALLARFRARAMASAAVAKLLRGWDRVVEVRVLGPTQRSYFLRSRGGAMEGPIDASEAGRPAEIAVAADDAVLAAIFGGELNPARAHLDGDLQAFGSQRDQLVLDSLVMLIWGF